MDMESFGSGIFYKKDFYYDYENLKQKVMNECEKAIFFDEEDKEVSRKKMDKGGYFLVKKQSDIYKDISNLNIFTKNKLENFFNKKYKSQWENTEYIGAIGLYPTGGFSDDHTDKIHNSQDHYSYSVVFYLNDNYKGGSLFFPEKNIRIFPEKNSAVFLPSDLIHRSEKILFGEKIIIPTFFKEN